MQSLPAQEPSALPATPEAALEQLATGFLAGSSGARDVRSGPFDAERRALRFQFEVPAAGAGAVSGTFAGVAFLTRGATVLALCGAQRERAADVHAAVALLWEQSRVDRAALEPAAPEAAFGVGRQIGAVLGSLLGGLLLTWALSALLVRARLQRATAVAVAGLALVGCAALALLLRGSREALLQLMSYVVVGGV